MKRFNYILLFAFALTCNTAFAQTAPQALANDLQSILDNALPNEQGAGGVLGVHVPGQWSYYTASGNAISGTTAGQSATMATPTTKFRVGSISKIFTSISILQLHESGALDINDPISSYLRASLVNDTIPNGPSITVKHLLNHTSGLGDAAANDSCQQDALNDLTRHFSLEENIFCGSQFAALPPDIMFSYSNTNYALLAMIIEEVSGVSYAQYITDNIITPLGLTDTYIPDGNEDEIATAHMGCYWWLVPGTYLADLTILDASLYTGWANVVSTTADLISFYEALRNDQLVGSATVAMMFTANSPSTWYGMGTELLEISGTDYQGHSGEVANTSGLYFCPISTTEFPDGYYISYNFNYQGVPFTTDVDVPVYNLMSNYATGLETMETQLFVSDVYPNPATDQTTLEINSNDNAAATLSILDLSGKQVTAPRQVQINSGNNRTRVDLSDVQQGVYVIVLTTADRSYNGRIVKLLAF